MSLRRLVIKSLRYHWRLHVTVALGTAVACAILGGSLIVGDSVRATLRSLARERLGSFEFSLAVDRFFRQELAQEMASSPSYPSSARAPVAIVLVDASATVDVDGERGSRAGQVSVVGVDEGFAELGFSRFVEAGGQIVPKAGQVILNQTLAAELHVDPGATVLISLRRLGVAPLESFLGDREESSRILRLEVGGVIPDRGPGLFSLRHSQAAPRLAYVERSELARAVGAPGRANVLLVATDAEGGSTSTPESSKIDSVRAAFLSSLTLSDLGLRLRTDDRGFLSLGTRRMVLSDATVTRAEESCRSLGWRTDRVLTHLAETIAVEGRDAEIPYSTMSALDPAQAAPLGPMKLVSGATAPVLKEGEILLNDWAARDLGLDGDASGVDIRIEYYVPRVEDRVSTATARFRLRGVVSLDGAAADAHLTPEFPGLTDSKILSIRNWDPPFDMDLDRVREVDDEYWKDHRATPKAFVSPADGIRYFRSRFGSVSLLRLVPLVGEDLADSSRVFERSLVKDSGLPEALGFVWSPARERGVSAASGPTDFGMLFVSFSFFLIVSAAILVALLFGLQMDGRARELGVYLASGYPLRVLRRLYLVESMVVASCGGVLGLSIAVAYAWALVRALETVWWEAVRVPYMVLSVEPLQLAVSFLSTEIVVLLTIWFSLRRLGGASVQSLLAGSAVGKVERAGDARAVKSRVVFLVAVLLALGLAVVSYFIDERARVGVFFGVGSLSLVAVIAGLSVWLREGRRGDLSERMASLGDLGCRNARRAPGRSLLTVALVSSATFTLVAVASMHHDPRHDRIDRVSGNGGFALAATSEVPVVPRIDTRVGREELRIDRLRVRESDGVRVDLDWDDLKAFYFRVKPGDDASCLNLNAPSNPRLLGASTAFVERGGFVFSSHLAETEEEFANPWKLLDRRFEDGAVPAIGDVNSTTWILKKGLGDDVVVRNETGQEVRLRIVATLKSSLFQGELIVGDSAFTSHFPTIEGYRFVLIELDKGEAKTISRFEEALEVGLETYGFDVFPTATLIASFLAVENTYLSTFQLLGGLGLLLGTLGLGVVLVRGVLERRRELALLRSLGFERKRLAILVFAEDALLLGFGVGGGAVAAALAVWPRLGDAAATIPWSGISGLLLLVVTCGLFSGLIAVGVAVRLPILATLRSE